MGVFNNFLLQALDDFESTVNNVAKTLESTTKAVDKQANRAERTVNSVMQKVEKGPAAQKSKSGSIDGIVRSNSSRQSLHIPPRESSK